MQTPNKNIIKKYIINAFHHEGGNFVHYHEGGVRQQGNAWRSIHQHGCKRHLKFLIIRISRLNKYKLTKIATLFVKIEEEIKEFFIKTKNGIKNTKCFLLDEVENVVDCHGLVITHTRCITLAP